MNEEDDYNYSDIEEDVSVDEESEENEWTELIQFIQNFEWANVLARIHSTPSEVRIVGPEGRTPLHIACDSDAPVVVIQALLREYPEASIMTGTSNMNPLHITCSSRFASVQTLRALLELGKFEQCSMRDVDGDTPLHAACRCGAAMEILEILLRQYPAAVRVRDYEGLTPLLRLWVRYFVILGDDVINSVNSLADLSGELLEAWRKTELLLRCAHLGNLDHRQTFSTLHAASAVDCPRSIVMIAAKILPHLLEFRDEEGRTPLMVACQAPVFRTHDLSNAGFALEHVVYEDTNEMDQTVSNDEAESSTGQNPSVIEILLMSNTEGASQGAALTDPSGRLPLHIALESGKLWNQGIEALVKSYPESVKIADQSSKLVPFQIAGIKSDLSTCYELMRIHPDLLNLKKRKRS